METSGIYITSTLIATLSSAERAFVLGLVSGERAPLQNSAQQETDIPARAAPTPKDKDADYDEHFAELSPGQAREFYKGCGAKTRAVIDVIAASNSRAFQLADVARALSAEAGSLRNVWSGLTMRTRTITRDESAYLIDWTGKQIYDENDVYVDQTGEVSELTYNSFRKLMTK